MSSPKLLGQGWVLLPSSPKKTLQKRENPEQGIYHKIFSNIEQQTTYENFSQQRGPADGLSAQHESVKKNFESCHFLNICSSAFAWGTIFIFRLPHLQTHVYSQRSELNSTNHKCLFVSWRLKTVTNSAPLTSMVLEDFRSVCSQDINRYSYKTVLRSNNMEKHLLKQSLYAERMCNGHQTPQDGARTFSMLDRKSVV